MQRLQIAHIFIVEFCIFIRLKLYSYLPRALHLTSEADIASKSGMKTQSAGIFGL